MVVKIAGIQNAWETQTQLSQGHALLLLQQQTEKCTAGSTTARETILPYSGPVEGSSGCTQQWLLGPSFSGGGSWQRLRQWLNCLALERGLVFPTSNIQLVLSSHLLNHLAGLILMTSAAKGNQSAVQSWDFRSMSPREGFVWEPHKQVPECVAILQGVGSVPISPESLALTT